MSNKLLSMYVDLLTSLDLTLHKNKVMKTLPNGDTMALMCGGKKLVLPIPKHLRKKYSDKYQVFHPMNEDILQRPSLVAKRMVAIFGSSVNYMLGNVLLECIDIVVSGDAPSSMTVKAALSKFGAVNKNDVKHITKVLTSVKKGTLPLVKLSLVSPKEGFTPGYLRRITCDFPVYKHLLKIMSNDVDREINGVKISMKACGVLKKSIEALIDGVNTPIYVSSASNVAPSVQCITNMITLAGEWINVPSKMYSLNYKIDTTFADQDYFSDPKLENIVRTVPALRGNSGTIAMKKPKPVPVVTRQEPDDVPPWEDTPQQPQQNQPPANNAGEDRGDNGQSWGDMFGNCSAKPNHSQNQNGWGNQNQSNQNGWGNQNQSNQNGWSNNGNQNQNGWGNQNQNNGNWGNQNQDNQNGWGNQNQNQNNGNWDNNGGNQNGWGNQNQNNGW